MGSKKQDLWMDPTDPLYEAEAIVKFLEETLSLEKEKVEIQQTDGLGLILQEVKYRIRTAAEMAERLNSKK